MRSTLFFISVFLFFISVIDPERLFAQDSLEARTTYKQSVEVLGEGFVNSNTITNKFFLAFYKGNFIDDALKENVTERLRSSNLLGGELKSGITYSVTRMHTSADSKKERAFSFSFYDRQHLDIKFSDDLFYTVFYGNKLFEGSTAHLGDFNLDILHYQQFRFGWDWKGDRTHGSYGFAFSLLNGQKNISASASTADLFTATDGTYLDFNAVMHMHMSDTASTKFFAQNGMGLSADFFYEMPYACWKLPGNIKFEVKDLGFIRWKSSSMLRSIDSAYHYDGLFVNDILNLSNTSAAPFSVKKVIDRNTKYNTRQYSTAIPCELDIRTRTFYSKQIIFEKGITFWFNTSAQPYYYARLHFLFGKKKTSDVAYVFGYGGYGRFNSGLDASFDVAKTFSVHLAENYLFSGVSSHSNYGQGLMFRLVKRF